MSDKGTVPACSIEGCDRLAWARGWCNPHYQRWRRYGDPLGGRTFSRWGEAQRYLDEILAAWDGQTDVSRPCRTDWPFARSTKGNRPALSQMSAARYLIGAPDGLDSSHLCHNRECIEPSHLIAESRSENVSRQRGDRHWKRQPPHQRGRT